MVPWLSICLTLVRPWDASRAPQNRSRRDEQNSALCVASLGHSYRLTQATRVSRDRRIATTEESAARSPAELWNMAAEGMSEGGKA